jgi:hypothetical protein
MADPITDPGSIPGVVPPAAPAPNDAAFARLRTEAAEAQKRADALDAKLKDIERGQMDEKTRLESELNEARSKIGQVEQLQADHGKYVAAMKAECDATLATIPDEDKRKTIAGIVEHVPLDQRLSAIRNACQAIGVGPIKVGTHTQPGNEPPPAPGPQEGAKPLTVEQLGKTGWGNAFAGIMNRQTGPTLDIDALAERVAQKMKS